MNATQQHMLDVYRAAQLGAPVPPAPGVNDWQVIREVGDYQRFRAGAAGRPVRGRGRLRTAVAKLFAAATRGPGARSSAARGSAARVGCSRPVTGAGSGACG